MIYGKCSCKLAPDHSVNLGLFCQISATAINIMGKDTKAKPTYANASVGEDGRYQVRKKPVWSALL